MEPWRLRLPELTWAELLLRVVLAAALGGAIGFERELRERDAGLRTHMLVSVGAALFTVVSAYAWTDWQFSNESGVVFDPTRIAAQIVTGIGFLGAGAIIRQGLSVRGLTTAATLWVVAAIGMASGAGYYAAAVITTALVLFSLWPLRILAYRISVRIRPEEGRLAVDLPAGASAVSVLEAVESAGARRPLARVRGGRRPEASRHAGSHRAGAQRGGVDRRPDSRPRRQGRPLEPLAAKAFAARARCELSAFQESPSSATVRTSPDRNEDRIEAEPLRTSRLLCDAPLEDAGAAPLLTFG